MEKEYYYVYCKGILGAKTNKADFQWVYGSTASPSSCEEYESCVVKLDLCVKPEKKLGRVDICDKRFQSYKWNSQTKTLYCRRKLFHCLRIGFNIKIEANTVHAEIGCNYYRFVRNRVMNLHGIYYLLSDLMNVILLKNKFLSLYASAVYSEIHDRCVVCFAPPNTGKTLTASKLCELAGYKLVGEDIVITDTKKVYSCPWTSSYRKASLTMDDAGSLGRCKKQKSTDLCGECVLTDLVTLSYGKKAIREDKREFFSETCILNGYLFGYYSTPIVKILAYFDEGYRKSWNDCAISMLADMTAQCDCRLISAEEPMEFYEIVDFENTGK